MSVPFVSFFHWGLLPQAPPPAPRPRLRPRCTPAGVGGGPVYEAFTRKVNFVPSFQVGCERYRVEGEMCRIQEALSERLGPPAVMLRRRDQRLHAINAIEKTIQRLRQEKPLPPASTANRPPSSGLPDGDAAPPDTAAAMDFLNANQVSRTPVRSLRPERTNSSSFNRSIGVGVRLGPFRSPLIRAVVSARISLLGKEIGFNKEGFL